MLIKVYNFQYRNIDDQSLHTFRHNSNLLYVRFTAHSKVLMENGQLQLEQKHARNAIFALLATSPPFYSPFAPQNSLAFICLLLGLLPSI